MDRRLRYVLPLAVLACLLACSDYSLSQAPEPLQESESAPGGWSGFQPPAGFDRERFGGSPGGGSPWGALDFGDLPEEYFAVAWNDPREGCFNCYVHLPYRAPRYDVVDIRGQVVASFELPWSGPDVESVDLQPAGPGRFLGVSLVYESAPTFLRAWFGDAVGGEFEEVLRLGAGPVVELPAAGTTIEFPQQLWDAQVLADPVDPNRLYVLPQDTSSYANPLLGTLYSVDVRDPEGELRTWEPEDMLGLDFSTEWGGAPWFPRYSRAFADGDRTVIVLGVQLQDAEGWRDLLVAFSPETGPLEWSLDLTGLLSEDMLKVQPPSEDQGGRALFQQGASVGCSSPDFDVLSPEGLDFALWDGESLVEVTGSEELGCSELGPLLEPSGETFLYFGAELQGDLPVQERLVISHRGQDVWEYDSFRVGLAEVPLDIHHLVRLELPEP